MLQWVETVKGVLETTKQWQKGPGRGGGDAVEKLLRLIDFFLAVCDPASGHGGRVHRGEALLQQPGGHRQPEGPEEAQSLPLQEGNRDLQLLLLQHHPGRQAQQTGGEGRGSGSGTPGVGLPSSENDGCVTRR